MRFLPWLLVVVVPYVGCGQPGNASTNDGLATADGSNTNQDDSGADTTSFEDASESSLTDSAGDEDTSIGAGGMGKAIVSTTIGAEGLPVTHGVDVVLADGAESFASEVLRLLEEPAERARLGAAARNLMVKSFSWSKAADIFADICPGRRRAAA